MGHSNDGGSNSGNEERMTSPAMPGLEGSAMMGIEGSAMMGLEGDTTPFKEIRPSMSPLASGKISGKKLLALLFY